MKWLRSLAEDDRYYFDAEAAERPIRFAAKYLRHYEGRFAGKSFTLLGWQQDLVRALFGWKRRADGLRRFRELYCLTAKSSGKTPMLSLIGMFMLLMDGEAGAHVISCATDFQQAYLTMDGAKKYIAADKHLKRTCDPKQFEIRVPSSNSKWTVLSGTAEGRHGFRPSCLLMDEAHEWPSGALYDNLTANMTKRAQPLTLVTTNAGASRSCFAWKLHERALAVLNGDPDASETLLPVIHEAPEELDWTSEEAARAANPSLGAIITFDQLKPELAKGKESPEAEARYRRLFLSQWQKTAAGRLIDMATWDACLSDEELPVDAPAYFGLDLAQSDDLCAAVRVAVVPDRFCVSSHFWLPRVTADRYRAHHGVPYDEWAAAGHITLLDEPTISPAVRRQIAAWVIAAGKGRTTKAICYDRYCADETVAALEASGLTCVPVAQGYSVSPGTHEMDRRLKERSLAIEPNPVLRFCAENAEAKADDRGNLWVAKPHAAGKFAGTRWQKVDGITALVTALVEARKHAFPPARKVWKGSACLA